MMMKQNAPCIMQTNPHNVTIVGSILLGPTYYRRECVSLRFRKMSRLTFKSRFEGSSAAMYGLPPELAMNYLERVYLILTHR
jgi:hypothetical protein